MFFSVIFFLFVLIIITTACPFPICLPIENPEEDTLPVPKNVNAKAFGKIITLDWDEVKDAYSYEIYISFESDGAFVYLGDAYNGTAFNVVSISNSLVIPLEPNTTYYFKICAYNGELSAEVSATTGA
jgi:hypothetical protein